MYLGWRLKLRALTNLTTFLGSHSSQNVDKCSVQYKVGQLYCSNQIAKPCLAANAFGRIVQCFHGVFCNV